MMKERLMQFWIGMFVISAGLVFALLMDWFGEIPTLFESKRYLLVKYESATGIGVGTPVHKSGIRVGEVIDIQFDTSSESDDRVQVMLELDSGFPLWEGTIPQISRGLLGDAAIELLPGKTKSLTPMATGSHPKNAPLIIGAVRSDPAQAIEVATNTISKASDTLETINRAANGIAKLTEQMENAGEFLAVWKKTGNKVGDVADGVARILEKNEPQIEPLMTNLRDASQKINDTFDKPTQTSIREAATRINEAAAGLAELRPLMQELADPKNTQAKTQLGQTIQRLNRISYDLALLTGTLSDGRGRLNTNGTLQKLLTSSELSDNYNRLALGLSNMLSNARPIVENLSRFTEKIAHDPSSLTRGALQRN